MAAAVTWEGLRELASFRAEKGCAISLYLGLDPSTVATAGELETRINSLLDEAGKAEHAQRANLTHEQRVALKADFDRVREFFTRDFDRDGAHGFALFC